MPDKVNSEVKRRRKIHSAFESRYLAVEFWENLYEKICAENLSATGVEWRLISVDHQSSLGTKSQKVHRIQVIVSILTGYKIKSAKIWQVIL